MNTYETNLKSAGRIAACGERAGWRRSFSTLRCSNGCARHIMFPRFTRSSFSLQESVGLRFMAGIIWTFYLALDPYVRRRWPQSMITWSRARR